MLNPGEDWPTVEQMLLSAPQKTIDEFNIIVQDDGQIASFQDRKLILVAIK